MNITFEIYVYIAPYNKKNEEIGKIQLYKVYSNLLILDFIKIVFKPNEWKIIHLYNIIDNNEVDKYKKFSEIFHRHAVIQLIYIFEDDMYYKNKYKKIRTFDDYELRDIYNQEDNLYNLLLKNANDNKILTKEFSVDKSTKIESFIKFNLNLI